MYSVVDLFCGDLFRIKVMSLNENPTQNIKKKKKNYETSKPDTEHKKL